MIATVSSFGLLGIDPFLVRVEVDVQRGVPAFDVVGLPDAAVKESRDRVRAAATHLGFKLPNARVVANLAPADIRKAGPVYDLPLLMALLAAAGKLPLELEETAVVGEISLGGEVRPVRGVFPMVLGAAELGIRRVIVPEANLAEAASAEAVEVFGVSHAGEIVDWVNGRGELKKPQPCATKPPDAGAVPDLADVRGQGEAKRALEVAAAGGHNLLLIGPPGTGKSMLARRLPSILPGMTREEAVETTKIYSVAGKVPKGAALATRRPFRAPHHNISAAALCGGGSDPRPGDLSLAHNGILFLDELPEFGKQTLEMLRQPLEEGVVEISRVRQRIRYPAGTMLVAAMNPCPCGFFGAVGHACGCSPAQIKRYLGKVSGPLLDRIDIQIEMQPISYEQMTAETREEPSAAVRERVEAARERQRRRYKGTGISCNAGLTPGLLREACRLEPDASALLEKAYDNLGLSARGYDRILKMARTIADLDGAEGVGAGHVSQAIRFRSLDRKYWAR